MVVQRYDRSPLIPLRVLADRNRGAAYLVLAVSNAAVFAVFLFLTYYFQGVLHYSPIKTALPPRRRSPRPSRRARTS